MQTGKLRMSVVLLLLFLFINQILFAFWEGKENFSVGMGVGVTTVAIMCS